MNIEILDEANRELERAASWYRMQQLGLELRFLAAFRTAMSRMLASPRAYPRVSSRSRRCRLAGFPYGIVYIIRETSLLIIAVMHLHRRPKYWRHREAE